MTSCGQCPRGGGVLVNVQESGADPGFRRGGSYIQKGGGGFAQEFQERIQIVAGPWANQQAKKNCRQPWGGGPITPQKNLYPRLRAAPS